MKRSKNYIRYIVSFVIMALFMYLAFRGQDLNALWASLTQVRFIWIVYLVVGGILSHVVRAWRWQYLLNPIKKNVTLRNCFSAVMIGYMINNFLPRVGEVVRPYTLGKLENISKTAAFGTVIIERIIDIITFYSILLAVMFIYSDSFAQLFPSFASIEPIFLAGAVFGLVFFIFLFFKAELIFSFLKKGLVFLPQKIRTTIDRTFDSFISGFAVAKQPGDFAMIIVTSYIIQGLYLLLMYIPFFAYDGIVSHSLDFGSAAILLVVSTVAFAVPTPSGFGTYHSFTSFTLTQLYHVDSVTALSYSVLTHEVGVLLTLVIGLYYFFRDHIRVTEIVADAG
ncbi:MAG TPA: lysylphosphatidylglycerol synthase transmembrane domain-containing protein [Bacteroidota bacterium]|nr:lysylphosphatidylglycerol synthase transmembrane domain-containing protein [Bacteroidota bacterium]